MRFSFSVPPLAFALLSATLLKAAPLSPDLPQLTAEQRTDLRCAAAFAIVATEQAGGNVVSGWPPLALRGKRFFADTGIRVMREAGLTRDAVRTALGAEVAALQSAKEPEAALADLAKPCTNRLDASVPPLLVPDLGQCAAIMGLAYDEVHAREGMTPAARDLRTLASVLSAREREALIAAGSTGDQADAKLAGEVAAMTVVADTDPDGIDKFDLAHCYELARPDEKTHY